MLAENLQVDFGVAMVEHTLFFDEVTRKCRPRDDVFRTAMHGEFFDIGSTSANQRQAVFIGKREVSSFTKRHAAGRTVPQLSELNSDARG